MILRTIKTMPNESRDVLNLRIKVPCDYECVSSCHTLYGRCAFVQQQLPTMNVLLWLIRMNPNVLIDIEGFKGRVITAHLNP